MGLKNTRVEAIYASVIADGTIRVKVDEGTEGAKKREGDLRDGTHFEKWELIYNELSGRITDISFYDGDYGKLLQITVNDGTSELPTILSLSTNSNFGEDMMKKLPNIDFDKDIIIRPYSFVDEHGKPKKGVTLFQDNNKITSFFQSLGKDGKVKLINGFPEPEKDNMDSEDWKIYFSVARKFLIKYTEDHVITKLGSMIEVSNDDELNKALTQ